MYKYHAVNFKLNSKQIEIFVYFIVLPFTPLLQGAKLQEDFFPYFSVWNCTLEYQIQIYGVKVSVFLINFEIISFLL